MSTNADRDAVAALTVRYLGEQQDRNARRMDRIFAVLMVVQWVAGMGVAAWLTPWTYAGAVRSLNPHVLQAIFGGALLSGLPIAMTQLYPGQLITRQVVAAAQMLWSALLIHLTGGRIETHFHVFGSLAFIAFYRDWRVLPTATLVVAADHFIRGTLAPMSVYGVVNPEWWRFLEHAFWVVFEDIVLVMSCIDGVREMGETALRRAEAEVLSNTLERRVEERTQQLSQANAQLTTSLREKHEAQRQLVEASRKAGMADVATAVLHNVGNVLNSVNVATSVIADTVKRSKGAGVAKLATLAAQPELAAVLESHPKTRQIAPYLAQVGEALGREQAALLQEVAGLQRNIEHIKVIVTTQQTHAKGGAGVEESVALDALLEEALVVNDLHRPAPGLRVCQELEAIPAIRIDRHKVFQILVNLLSNARHAARGNGREEGTVTLRLRERDGWVRLEVQDDGYGIAPENLARVFNHGFTTKTDGHGFGLHSSANTAREMGGQLTAASDGLGRGATFSLELPLNAVRAAA